MLGVRSGAIHLSKNACDGLHQIVRFSFVYPAFGIISPVLIYGDTSPQENNPHKLISIGASPAWNCFARRANSAAIADFDNALIVFFLSYYGTPNKALQFTLVPREAELDRSKASCVGKARMVCHLWPVACLQLASALLHFQCISNIVFLSLI